MLRYFKAVIASLAVFLQAFAVSATENTPEAGLWIAVDEAYADFIYKGLIVPTEELLIFNDDGTAESRLMFFYQPSVEVCASGKGSCSDALRTRVGDAAIEGDQLTFKDIREPQDLEGIHPSDRLAVGFTAMALSPQWTVAVDAKTGLMKLTSGAVTRLFAPIEHGRLAALRAAFLQADFSAARHWRCFMAAATFDDPAFATIGEPRRPAPAWFSDFADASYILYQLAAKTRWPTGDNPLYQGIDLKALPLEWFFIPESAMNKMPETRAAQKVVFAQMVRLQMLQSGMSADEALKVARSIDPLTPEAALIDEKGIEALQRVTALRERGKDTAIDELYCNDGRSEPPKPRIELNPFITDLSK